MEGGAWRDLLLWPQVREVAMGQEPLSDFENLRLAGWSPPAVPLELGDWALEAGRREEGPGEVRSPTPQLPGLGGSLLSAG